MAAPDWDVGADFVRVAIVVLNVLRMLVFMGLKGARVPRSSRRNTKIYFREQKKCYRGNTRHTTAVIPPCPPARFVASCGDSYCSSFLGSCSGFSLLPISAFCPNCRPPTANHCAYKSSSTSLVYFFSWVVVPLWWATETVAIVKVITSPVQTT